jgi:hypothetical protein
VSEQVGAASAFRLSAARADVYRRGFKERSNSTSSAGRNAGGQPFVITI